MAVFLRAQVLWKHLWLTAQKLPPRFAWAGIAICLQGVEESSRNWSQMLFGQSTAALFSFLLITLSLLCLCLVVSPRLPCWLTGKVSRVIVKLAVIGCLVLGIAGLGELVYVGYASFQAPVYYNDGALLDHNAALLLLHGQNPYTHSDLVAAMRNFHQSAAYSTPLQQGKLAGQQDYPSSGQLQALLAQEPIGHPDQGLEFESHVSYPALAFLVLVPLVWAGAPTVVPFYLICLVLFAIFGLRSVRREWRWWVALLFLADIPLINSTLDGNLDVFWVLLIFLAWRSARRWWLSAVLLGLALASKQTAWLYLPFYFLFVCQYQGFRDALRRLVLASTLFLAINLPFILLDGGAWIVGVLAPVRDPLYPQGAGLIALSIGKLLPFLPRAVYAVLEGLALLAVLLWYRLWGRLRPEAAMILAVFPLFLAWRSLPSYFDFCALLTVLLTSSSSREVLTTGHHPSILLK